MFMDDMLGRSRHGSWQFLRRNSDLTYDDFAERILTPRSLPSRDRIFPLSARGTRTSVVEFAAFGDDETILQHPAATPSHPEAGQSSPASSPRQSLRCTTSFKCIPDPRWKQIFSRSAKEFEKAVQLEKRYTQMMLAYKGEQISRKRIELNTPRGAKLVDPAERQAKE
eukprot:372507-Hanusia_phi.AAC.3